jgi:hypothetical protein
MQMVLLFEKTGYQQFVRLNTHDFRTGLGTFLRLQPELEKMRHEARSDVQIVDLRSPGIALVK